MDHTGIEILMFSCGGVVGAAITLGVQKIASAVNGETDFVGEAVEVVDHLKSLQANDLPELTPSKVAFPSTCVLPPDFKSPPGPHTVTYSAAYKASDFAPKPKPIRQSKPRAKNRPEKKQ